MNQSIRSYKDLIAWQKAFRLGLDVYQATAAFPPDERFGLVSQLRRGGIAVASNIAEGYGRGSKQDYIRFLRIARGALYEIETQLLFAGELGYLGTELIENLNKNAEECSRILGGLIASVGRS